MKRVLILSAAVLFCGVPLRAQVTKQVEVTKTYVPEVSKAVKLPIVPDMTDTVRLRPEIDYTVTPSALATNLSTEPFRPATVTYWEFDRPRPLYLKVGAGAPLNSVLDLYASTQNPGTGYVVGYLNHTGDWAEIRNDFGVRPVSWRMHNRMGAAAGKYLGRRLLEGKLDLTNRVYHNYGFDGITKANISDESGYYDESYAPFRQVVNDRQHYDDAMLHVRIGDDFTDLSRFNFDVELRGGYFLNASQMYPVLSINRYHEFSGGGGIRLARAFGLHEFEFKADFDGTWRNVRDYRSTQLLFGLHYTYRHDKLRWSVGLDYVRDGVGKEVDVLVVPEPFKSDPVLWYWELQTEYNNRFLPAASIAYDPADGKFMLYAELTGRVRRNDMRTLSRLNPYVYPCLIRPNTEEHRVAGGIKGVLGHGRFSYKLYVDYAHEENALQWVARFMSVGPENMWTSNADDIICSAYYQPYTMTLKDLSLNAEFAWRPSSRFTFDGELHMHSFKGAEDVYYNNNQPYTLAYGRPQLTARLRGEYRARKVSLEVEAQMQSVRHWTAYTFTYEQTSTNWPGFNLDLLPMVGLYDFKVPVTVDLAARFNWFLSRKVTLFAEGRNLCDAKLYDWAYYRDYGVGFTAGVKLQF